MKSVGSVLVIAIMVTVATGGCGSGAAISPASPGAGTGGLGGRSGPSGMGGLGGHGDMGAPGGGGGGTVDDLGIIMQTYRSWQALSDRPIDISAEIFALCRLPTTSETQFADSIHGRHGLRDWANPDAMVGLARKGAGGFPVGAAIVKEKYKFDGITGAWQLAALGMVVKRSAGFAAASGDWEFAYWNADDGLSRGPSDLATCSACHAATRESDFVFIDSSWRIKTAN